MCQTNFSQSVVDYDYDYDYVSKSDGRKFFHSALKRVWVEWWKYRHIHYLDTIMCCTVGCAARVYLTLSCDAGADIKMNGSDDT